jgi:hypothetical protein
MRFFLGSLNQDHGKGNFSLLDPFCLLFSKKGNFRGSAMILELPLALKNGKREGDRNQETEAQNLNE